MRSNRSAEAQAWRRFYNTARWKRTREAQLKAEPLCRACTGLGIVTPATVCNHMDKAAKATEQGFFRGPFSSLCAPCHDAGEQKAEIAGYTAECDETGWPTSSSHPANGARLR